MHNVENLKIWKKSIELTKRVYSIVAELPADEKYGLSSQIKRSCISIPSNIAEGAGRNTKKEFKHFLSVANGSSYELQTQLILTTELNLIAIDRIQCLLDLTSEVQKMNYSLQNSLDQKSNS